MSYEIKVIKNTACLMLMKDGSIIDCKFINDFFFNNIMTIDDFLNEVKLFAERNKIENYNVTYD